MVLDFHVANLLNDKAVDPAFGYTPIDYAFLKASPILETDGASSNNSPQSSGTLRPGAVQYHRWNSVRNFQLDVGGNSSRLVGKLVLESYTNQTTTIDLMVAGEGNFLSGNYRSVTMVLTNGYFASESGEAYDYTASWAASQSQFSTQDVIYDDGTVSSIETSQGSRAAFELSDVMRVANRVPVPLNSWLSSVKVDHLYLSEFPSSTVPYDSPRDFTLFILDETDEGEPGDVLFSLDVTDTTPQGFWTVYDFMTIPLGDYEDQLINLPSTVYIGVGNAGSDQNRVIFTISNFDGDSPSLLNVPGAPSFPASGWAPFSTITYLGGSFANSVVPIRARFVVSSEPVDTETDLTVPQGIALSQNYPNPFNPSTAIEFSLPQAEHVRLTVFDMLGRRVATLVDDFRRSGEHRIDFQASDLSSGIYVYSLETETSRVTRTMTLLK